MPTPKNQLAQDKFFDNRVTGDCTAAHSDFRVPDWERFRLCPAVGRATAPADHPAVDADGSIRSARSRLRSRGAGGSDCISSGQAPVDEFAKLGQTPSADL